MHEGGVIAAALIRQDDFPVGLDAVLEKARRDLDLAFRRGANEAVYGFFGAAKMLLQRRAFGSERAKDKTAIGLHPCDAAKPEICLVVPFITVLQSISAPPAL